MHAWQRTVQQSDSSLPGGTQDKHWAGTRIRCQSSAFHSPSLHTHTHTCRLFLTLISLLLPLDFNRRYFFTCILWILSPALESNLGKKIRTFDVKLAEPACTAYQVEETPHSILVGADALARVKASLCHFSPHQTSSTWENRRGKSAVRETQRSSFLSTLCSIVVSHAGLKREETARLGTVSTLCGSIISVVI